MRLLIVEDEVAMVRSLKRGFEAEGYTVDVATDGEDGLWRAQQGLHDAVILDVMLPKLNGFRVCSQLRASGYAVPVLMLTAKQGDLDQAEALDTGADDFLSKPFSYAVLLARVRALIRRGSAGAGVVLSVGSLCLDTAQHRCWRDGAEVTLTAREYSLLEYLMHRPGQVATKGELLDHVWDPAVDRDSNVVEVYIGYLRRKLDMASSRSPIETVRGAGYRVAADA